MINNYELLILNYIFNALHDFNSHRSINIGAVALINSKRNGKVSIPGAAGEGLAVGCWVGSTQRWGREHPEVGCKPWGWWQRGVLVLWYFSGGETMSGEHHGAGEPQASPCRCTKGRAMQRSTSSHPLHHFIRFLITPSTSSPRSRAQKPLTASPRAGYHCPMGLGRVSIPAPCHPRGRQAALSLLSE